MNVQEKIAKKFIAAFESSDFETMGEILAPDSVSYITNASGGVDKVVGGDAFLERVIRLGVEQVRPNVRITQSHTVSHNQVMLMVEITAQKKTKALHNFAAFLFTFRKNSISEMHMVEALPAYSDEFWKKDYSK